LRKTAERSKRKARTEAEAERCFQQALTVARQQKAKSLELRATLNLGRVWAAQGEGKKARSLLSKRYHWFTEGFTTADLKEAKVLLEELS